MNIDELKSNWEALNERISNLEEQNKTLAMEAIKTKLSKRTTKLRAILSIKVFGLAVALLIFLKMLSNSPSVYGDWGVRIIGLMVVVNIFFYVFNYRNLMHMNPIKESISTVISSSTRFRLSFNYLRIANIILAIIGLSFIGIWFHEYDILFYAFMVGIVSGIIIAIRVFIKMNIEMSQLKEEIAELKSLS